MFNFELTSSLPDLFFWKKLVRASISLQRGIGTGIRIFLCHTICFMYFCHELCWWLLLIPIDYKNRDKSWLLWIERAVDWASRKNEMSLWERARRKQDLNILRINEAIGNRGSGSFKIYLYLHWHNGLATDYQ